MSNKNIKRITDTLANVVVSLASTKTAILTDEDNEHIWKYNTKFFFPAISKDTTDGVNFTYHDARFDNVGAGSATHDWGTATTYRAFEAHNTVMYGKGGTTQGGILCGAYRDNVSGWWKATATDAAAYFKLIGSSFVFYTSDAVGAIGDTRTWVNRGTFDTAGLSITNALAVGGTMDTSTWQTIVGTTSVPSFMRFYLTGLAHGATDILPTNCAGDISTTVTSAGEDGGLDITGIGAKPFKALAVATQEPTAIGAFSLIGGITSSTSYTDIAATSFLLTLKNHSSEVLRIYGDGRVNLARSLYVGSITGGDPGDNNAAIDGALTVGGSATINTDLVLSVTSNDAYIANPTSDKDIYIQINDGGTVKNAIVIDASTARVGVGNFATAGQMGFDFNVVGSGASIEQAITAYVDSTSSGAVLRLRHSKSNTFNTLAETSDGTIGTILGYGVNSSSAFVSLASIDFEQDGAAGATYCPGRMIIKTGTAAAARAEALRIDSNRNVGIGATSFGANSVSVLGIANGTVPDAHVDNTIQIYSVDSSDNTATLGLMLEQAVEAIGTFTASHKIKVKINGTEYWLELDAV